ncbi:MAG: putative peptidoglycan glycosyltransferase FtsW [Planktomarina sp.]|nr:putative peptidoglycan glycosyltransferase FtsW [Planktomarina sp.]
MTEMVHGPLPVEVREAIIPRWWRTVDRWTMASVLFLFVLGIILALAASPPLAERNGLPAFHYVERQAVFGVLALIAMIITSMMEPSTVRRWATVAFGFALASLVLLPIFGTDFGKGATRWYSLGFASIQPSEFIKPAFVVFAAWLIAASFEPDGPPGRLMSFAAAITIAGFLALQPDFGQASLILFAWAVMYFSAGAPLLFILLMAGASVFAGMIAYNNSEHFARRIDGYLSANVDPTTQLGYAADAIREGGLFGVGAGEGSVKWSLPDAHTDFIIAVAAEEYGMIMVLLILGLFCLIVLRTLVRLLHERDLFVRLAGTGLVAVFGVQAMINIGVAVRLLPAKGMTLPFVSYGGSSLIAGGIALGMILAFTRIRPQGALGTAIRGY